MFKSRLTSGIILVILAFVTVIAGGEILAAVLCLISLIAYGELCKVCEIHKKQKGKNYLEIIGYISIVLYYTTMILWKNPMHMAWVVSMSFIFHLFIFLLAILYINFIF